MFSQRIKNGLSVNRLDAGYYAPEFIADEGVIKKWHRTQLDTLRQTDAPIVYGVLKPDDQGWDGKHYRVIKAEKFEGSFVDCKSCDSISKEMFFEFSRAEVKTGDLVVAIGGYVGRPALVQEIPVDIKAVVNRHLARIRTNKDKIERYYLVAYLSCSIGSRQLTREITGSVQAGINLGDLRLVEIPLPNSVAQKYIGNKVRQAETLRAWAKKLQCEIFDYFISLSSNPPAQKRSWRVKTKNLVPYRINPKHYDPVVTFLINRAKKQGVNLVKLGELIGDRGISGGATPKGAAYPPKGVFFVRVQNVNMLQLDLSDAVYIDDLIDEELTRSRCKENDIILSITGYPGTASLVGSDDLPININQHSVRFDVKDNIDPGYVCAAINSQFVKYQVNRLAIGGTREALDYKSVKDLLIPLLSADVQKSITLKVYSHNRSARFSRALIQAAKLLTEALIEQKLTEQDLINTQQALDKGDTSLDRNILRRLTTTGIDNNDPPLFPDLDQLYQLLKQADNPMEEE